MTSSRAMLRVWGMKCNKYLSACEVTLIYTVPDTHKFPLDARIRIALHARIRIASHRIACGEMRACASLRIACAKCAHMRAFASHARKCAHMRAFASHARICAHSHRMRGNARITTRKTRNEIAGMTPARVFWCQTPETGFVVVRCIHKYWG